MKSHAAADAAASAMPLRRQRCRALLPLLFFRTLFSSFSAIIFHIAVRCLHAIQYCHFSLITAVFSFFFFADYVFAMFFHATLLLLP